MKLLSATRFLVFLFIVALFADLFLTACASRGNPTGGPRDTIAPQIDTTFPPNFTTNFKSNEIEVIFKEFITLKSASQQIRITPPLAKKLEIKSGLRDLEIELTADSLLPNTTYTITFGTSITDFTEGNVNDKFSYVFSTGSFIDSLSLEGNIANGKEEGLEGILVALYDYGTLDVPDSIPFKALPTYYAYTDEHGNFKLENLKYGRFAVIAFEDKGGKFKMLANNQTMAFLGDTLKLDLKNTPLKMQAFEPEPTPRFVSARHVAANKIRLAFGGSAKGVQVKRRHPDQGKKAAEDYLEYAKSDTLFYWFQGAQDSLELIIEKPGFFIDTTMVSLREFPEKDVRFTVLTKELAPQENLYLKSSVPLLSTDKNGFAIFTDTDTIVDLKPTISDTNQKILVFQKPPRAPKTELLMLKKGIIPFSGNMKDSVNFSYKSLKKEDVGTAIFSVKADSNSAYILIVSGPNGDRIIRQSFTDSTQVNLRNLLPGQYNAQLIVDKDKNGRWSTGSYPERKQPEKIIRYNDALEIRANWDLEVEWVLSKSQLNSSN
jgi:uncharacterized protein (DUF2141 family)